MMRCALVSLLALAACANPPPERVAFCDTVTRRPIFSEHVRVEAVGLFGDHGVLLRHPDCPTVSAFWAETEEFENDQSSDILADAIHALRFDMSPRVLLDPEDLAVDITARYHWRGGRPEFVVETVHSVRRAPRVYANDSERNFTRCETIPAVEELRGEWRAACAAEEEELRTQRRTANN
ncbi:MAG: hypothetical protein NT015_12310 [Alphaproteobacteria bacterium]|nr:hypothetical protein [Alphaproteobacteria bacterium]